MHFHYQFRLADAEEIIDEDYFCLIPCYIIASIPKKIRLMGKRWISHRNTTNYRLKA